jgi:hypothetical protein
MAFENREIARPVRHCGCGVETDFRAKFYGVFSLIMAHRRSLHFASVGMTSLWAMDFSEMLLLMEEGE